MFGFRFASTGKKRRVTPGPPRFRHQALLYAADHECVDGVARFLREGISGSEPTLVAMPRPALDDVRDAMTGTEREQVVWHDMAEIGANPARLIPQMSAFAAQHGNATVRLVGQPLWPGRRAEEVEEVARHESISNLAFARRGAVALCPYDTRVMADDVVDSVRRTHPLLADATGRVGASPDFEDPAGFCAAHRWPLRPPPADAAAFPLNVENLSAGRDLVRDHAIRTGLTEARLGDLLVAFTEAATNALLHGSGDGTLLVWDEPPCLVIEVDGDGVISDPLAGRRLPATDGNGGRGLWLINELCDLVQLRSGPGGTTVRMDAQRDSQVTP